MGSVVYRVSPCSIPQCKSARWQRQRTAFCSPCDTHYLSIRHTASIASNADDDTKEFTVTKAHRGADSDRGTFRLDDSAASLEALLRGHLTGEWRFSVSLNVEWL